MTTKTKRADPPAPPVHLLVREEGSLARIGCGTPVSNPSQYSDRVLKASCLKCAKLAPGLTDEQRTEIYDNGQDRCGRAGISPWERAKRKAEREAARKAKAAEKAAAKTTRKAAASARAPF